LHEGFGDRICIVVAVREVEYPLMRREHAITAEQLDGAAFTLPR
jgi:hypothetical protein